mgnify:CR=1 FL=1
MQNILRVFVFMVLLGVGAETFAQCTIDPNLTEPGTMPMNLPETSVENTTPETESFSFFIPHRDTSEQLGVVLDLHNLTYELDSITPFAVDTPGGVTPVYAASQGLNIISFTPNASIYEADMNMNPPNDLIGCVEVEYQGVDGGQYQIGLSGIITGYGVVLEIPDFFSLISGIPGAPELPGVGDTLTYEELQDLIDEAAAFESFLPDTVELPEFSVQRTTPGQYGSNVFVTDPVSVNEALATETDFRIFPNPGSGQSTVAFKLQATRQVNIRLMDLTGRTVNTLASGNYPAGEHNLRLCADCGELAPGVYFLQVNLGEEHFSRRVVVQ